MADIVTTYSQIPAMYSEEFLNTLKTRAQIFGENLARIRRKKNVSRKQLAAALGITVDSIGAYESGKNLAPLDRIFQMANFLEVSITSLTGENEYSHDYPTADNQILEYRLRRAMFMAHGAHYFPEVNDEGGITICIPIEVVTDAETGVVTFKQGYNPIKFKDTADFVKVMEQAEDDAVRRNITFNKAMRKLLFSKK